MTYKKNKAEFFDDAAGFVGSIVGMISDVKHQVKGDIESRVKIFADDHDLAHKDDIEALNAKIDDLASRIDALEKAITKKKK